MKDEKSLVQTMAAPLFESKGWLKFLGIIFIVYGVLSALTIVGLLIAWLPIWIGIILNKAATASDSAYITGNPDSLREAMLKLKLFFTIYGVLALISLILTIGWIIVTLATGGALLNGLSGYF